VTFETDNLAEYVEERISARPGAAPFRHLALIGNALPRRCGLATYTSDVADALRQRYPAMKLDHYAMDDGSGIDYPDHIITIDAENPAAYREVAERIEASGAEAIWLQHEFGIFGGVAGSDILELTSATGLALIVTLHTVLEEPNDEQEAVLSRLIARADRTIVMAATGADILKRHYGVSPDRISIVPHGVPDRPHRDPDELKPQFGWQGRKVLMTFGLITPDKGIRHMIEAMPAIVKEHPEALYEIVGATHPNLVRKQGEGHRTMLIDLARELGVEDHVRFVDRFVEQEELLDMLQAADIYVTPYLNMAQVTSGTLSYAVAVGKPVIATPYVHAREILADGHGLIVPPGDPAALAEAAIGLLSNDEKRHSLAGAAYHRGREMLWPRVVERSLEPLEKMPQGSIRPLLPRHSALPLDAIQRMTDGVGMLQHAVYSVPNRDHGYCIDDNARALMVAVRRDDDQSACLAPVFAAFLQHGWNSDLRRFRNFMGYDRQWLESVGSEDSNGRTLWALGMTAARSPSPGLRDWALQLFEQAAPYVDEYDAPRAKAFAALGGYELLRARPGHDLARWLLEQSAEQLLHNHFRYSREGWDWFEPELAYDNARLPEVLIRAGMVLDEPVMVDRGLATLSWLMRQQTGPRGTFRPVGCHGFFRPYAPPLAFDQQPVEAAATLDAAAAAHEVSGREEWRQVARDAFAWFFGDNDAGVPLADSRDGSCFDGLMATGINRNQGAESILSLHLAALTMREAFGEVKRTGQERETTSEARTFAAS
jgi:glycosyltransferase involved in cell wall biosynthesis